MRDFVRLQALVASSLLTMVSCSKKKSEATKPAGVPVEQFIAILKTEDAESFKVELAKAPNTKPRTMFYNSGRVYVDLDHPWFRQASCEVDHERTGAPTGGCMFTFRASVKGRVDEMADAFAAVDPDLSPLRKRVTDAVTEDYEFDLGDAGKWEPGGPLFICTFARGREERCKAVSIALVTAKLPRPSAPPK